MLNFSTFLYQPFFSTVEKLNISAIYKAIVIIIPVNLPMVLIYKFFKKEIQIQPPVGPQEQHLSEVWYGTSKLKNIALFEIEI